jgi:hypothetical protein
MSRYSRACEHHVFPVRCVGAVLVIGGVVGLVFFVVVSAIGGGARATMLYRG